MKQQYIAVVISCDETLKEILMAELGALQYDSFLETDDGLEAYIEKDQFSEAALHQLLTKYHRASDDYRTQLVEEKNWNVEWEKHFEPIVVDEQCLVRATFHRVSQTYPYEIVIDPKMAFGTGHHATTYLMLQWQLALDQHGKTVMDAGCGTGVLAIMAKKRGADKVVAFDNNEWAVDNSQENFALNNCSDIQLFLGTVEDIEVSPAYDLILANINRNVLLEEMDFYAERLKSEGSLLLSGFLAPDQALIEERAQVAGLRPVGARQHNGWIALRLQFA